MAMQERLLRRSGSPLGWLALLLFCALSFSACRDQPQKPAGPPEKVTIAYPTTLFSVLYHIACSNGFFRAEGLEITPQPHELGKMALSSMLEGKADLAITADTPIMLAVTSGNEISTIGVTMTSKRANAIVARKDHGITIPANLTGKTVGVPLGTTPEFFLDSFLSTRGMDRTEVSIIDMRPGEMLEALTSGRVDAVSIWNPTLIQLRRALGNNGVVFYDEIIYSDIACVAARPELVQKRPETVKRVLMALVRAEMFVKENPEESRRLTAEFLKMDPAVLDEIWGSYDFRVTLDQSLIVSLEDQTRWAQQHKLTSSADMPDYLDFIYFDGLQSVKPEAVRILR